MKKEEKETELSADCRLSHFRWGGILWYTLLLFLLFPFSAMSQESVVRSDTLPPDNSRYLYLKKQLCVEFTVSLHAGESNYFTPLLQISSNENEYYNLFLDYQVDTPKQLLLYSRTNIRKLPIPIPEYPASVPSFEIKFLFNQQSKNFHVSVGDTLYLIDNLGFDPKAGYKFNFPLLNDPVVGATGQQSVQISQIRFIQTSDKRISRTFWYWFVFVLIIDLLIFGAVQLRKRRIRNIQARTTYPAEPATEQRVNNEIPEFTPPVRSAVYLFGNFHIYDAQGNNITRKFTPLLKELFLLLLIYTPEKGITSEKLREILWFDKNEQSAKNNRAVNMGKLRTLLESVGEIGITNRNGSWELLLNDKAVYVDYLEYINLCQASRITSREGIDELLHLVQSGGLLTDTHYEWLDRFKSRSSDFIIDTFTQYAETRINRVEQPDLALRIAGVIFRFDPLNEFALQLRIQGYVALGKHSLAKKAYERFAKEYSETYGQKFDKSFIDIR